MNQFLFTFVSLSVLSVTVMGEFTDQCKKCICEVEGCEKLIGSCNPDVGGTACVPYQIHTEYYQDCTNGGNDWKGCTQQMACSEQCMRDYFKRYISNCGSNPTCEDYARVHNGGPQGCNSDFTLGYWGRVNDCCQKNGGC